MKNEPDDGGNMWVEPIARMVDELKWAEVVINPITGEKGLRLTPAGLQVADKMGWLGESK